ncbi:MAG: TolC family protein [bacterium]
MKKTFIFMFVLIFFALSIFINPVNKSYGYKYNKHNKKITNVLSLDMLIKNSLKNPNITSKAIKTEGQKEKIIIAKALPEPVIGFGLTDANGFNNPEIGVEPMSDIGFSISQMIPFPSKLETKSQINRYSYMSSKEKTQALKVNTVYLVKAEYYELALIEKQISVIKYDRMLLKIILNYTSQKYGVGEASAPAYVRTMLEDSSLAASLFSLDKAKSKLIYLLSEQSGFKESLIKSKTAILSGIKEAKSSMPGYKTILKEAFKFNPDLKSVKYLHKKSNKELALAKESYLPDFYLKAGYGYRYSMVPVLSASVGLSLPVYFNSYQAPLVNKAEKDNLSSIYNISWEKLRIIKNMKVALKNMKEDYNNYKLYKNLYVPEAKLLFKSELSSFRVQKTTGFSLLDSFRKLVDSEFKKDIYRSKFFTDKASLDLITGKIQ